MMMPHNDAPMMSAMTEQPLWKTKPLTEFSQQDLVERGVDDFHFYTMNRADLPFAISHMIGIRSQEDVEGSAAA